MLRNLPILTAMLVLGLLIQPAHAFPAKDLMEKFSSLERAMYFKALVDMASYHAAIDQNHERANCINEWFFDPDTKEAVAFVEKAFERFPDTHAARTVVSIINLKCGKPKNWPTN